MQDLDKELLSNILDILISKNGDYSDIYYQDEDLFTFTIENNKVKSLKVGSERGLNLRYIKGDKTFSSSSSDFSPEVLKQIAVQIPVSMGNNIITSKKIVLPSDIINQENISFSRRESLINKFLACSESLKARSEKIVQSTFRYLTSVSDILLVNSKNEVVFDRRKYSRFIVQIVAQDGNIIQTAYEGPGITGNDDVMDVVGLEEITEKVAERAIMMLTAKPAPTGRMPVVMMGEAGGTMVHEACGHSLEADFIYKGTSNLKDKIGQKVASENVTVIDDATVPGVYGSYEYDDEGVPAKRSVLIENGVLKSYMTDRLSAGLLGLELSGNGRRESFRSKPVPRMSNTFIEDRNMLAEEIVDTVDQGLLVKKMGGGQVNITNGDFVFEISEGYLIEKGKVKHPIRGASLIGNGIEVLKNIEMVGKDKMFMPGVCGKYDHVPVSDAQPTMRIAGLTIGGS
ncbi:MAG: TldD/PmbA family protein [Candidatus Margulisbacteria bacterium]|nr:TldD/PmbA family protein [Candidatus Margulisiibacteriota bacterium]